MLRYDLLLFSRSEFDALFNFLCSYGLTVSYINVQLTKSEFTDHFY